MKKRKLASMLLVLICCAFVGIAGKTYSERHGVSEAAGEAVYTKLNISEQNVRIKQVALTFDDGPHAVYTEKLLDGLKERGVKATFFLMGINIEGNEDIVQRISDEGHLIGNHTYNHVVLTNISLESACEDILKDNEAIYNITGMYPSYVRPPFGYWSDVLDTRTGLTAVLWDIDPRDWECQNAELIYQRVIDNVENGDIILLHDIFNSSVEAAFKIIDELQSEGYEFVTVDRLTE